TLRVGATRSGARCYLCVRGGFDAKLFLGSSSTHLLSGLGGHEGRALRKGDILKIGSANSSFHKRTVTPGVLQRLQPRKMLRVTPGPQCDLFSTAAQKMFYADSYRVAEEADRMGLRLEGTPLPVDGHGEMTTEGVSLGAIQITPAGLPIILF